MRIIGATNPRRSGSARPPQLRAHVAHRSAAPSGASHSTSLGAPRLRVIPTAAILLTAGALRLGAAGTLADAQFEGEITISWPPLSQWGPSPTFEPTTLVFRYALKPPTAAKMRLVRVVPTNGRTPFRHREGATYIFGPGSVSFFEFFFKEWRQGTVADPKREGALTQHDLSDYRPFLTGMAAAFLGVEGAQTKRSEATLGEAKCRLLEKVLPEPVWCDDAHQVRKVLTWVDSERRVPLRCEWHDQKGEAVRTWTAERVEKATTGQWWVAESKTVIPAGSIRVTEKGSLTAERLGQPLQQPPREVDLPWPGKTITTTYVLVEDLAVLPKAMEVRDDKGQLLLLGAFRNHRVNTGLTAADFQPPE